MPGLRGETNRVAPCHGSGEREAQMRQGREWGQIAHLTFSQLCQRCPGSLSYHVG